MNEDEYAMCGSLTMLLRNWIDCTSPTWHNYVGWVGLCAALAEQDNE